MSAHRISRFIGGGAADGQSVGRAFRPRLDWNAAILMHSYATVSFSCYIAVIRGSTRMGGLWIEADSQKRYPVSWFGLSDTKWLLDILTDAPFLAVCSHVFGLDLQPLEKIETEWLNFNLG